MSRIGSRRWLAVAVLLVADLACNRGAAPRPPEPAHAPEPGQPAAPSPALPELDGARMTADIALLAGDEMHGRHTLSPDLRRAADFLVQRYTELGLTPLGPTFTVDFSLVTGARALRPPTLAVHRGAATRPAGAADFAPVPQSASGEVRGGLVFVGYAARSEADEGKPPEYDDLAGVDLRGKVALVLLEAPGRPDPMALFGQIQADAKKFAEAARPLKEAGDVARLTALHAAARADLLALVRPFMPEDALKDVWPLPDDPRTVEYNPMAIGGALMKAAASAPGPRFGFSEGALRTKVERLAKAGAVGVIAVRGPRSFVSEASRKADALPSLTPERPGRGGALDPLPVPVVQMRWKAADRLLSAAGPKISQLQAGIDGKRAPRSGPVAGVEVALAVALEPESVTVPNVVASLPGSGDRAGEIVVIGAHYDHIGEAPDDECGEQRSGDVVDKICNGADDNASGTAMVLELARLFRARAPGPRRTLVFTHFAGEELGVLGSKALAERPPFDLSRVVAMVNLDMVGRLGPKGLAIGGLGSSEAWMPLLDEVGPAGLEVLYEASTATRSDHASFYRKDIPVLFFFTGTHADYHRPGDTVDKINQQGMLAIGRIVGGVLQALGDGRAVPFNKAGPGLASGLPGSDPKTIVKKVEARP